MSSVKIFVQQYCLGGSAHDPETIVLSSASVGANKKVSRNKSERMFLWSLFQSIIVHSLNQASSI